MGNPNNARDRGKEDIPEGRRMHVREGGHEGRVGWVASLREDMEGYLKEVMVGGRLEDMDDW